MSLVGGGDQRVGAVLQPDDDPGPGPLPVCRERTVVGRGASAVVPDLGNGDAGRVESGGLDDGPFDGPRDEPIAAGEGAGMRDLGVGDAGDDERGQVGLGEDGIEGVQSGGGGGRRGGRAEDGELRAVATAGARAAEFFLRDEFGGGSEVQAGDGLAWGLP